MIANIQHWTELIARRLSGNIRDEDSRILDAWIARDPEHREYYNQLSRLWSVTGSNQTQPALPDADWKALEQKLSQPQKKFQVPQIQVPKSAVSPMLRRTISIAAAVTLLIVVTIALIVNRTGDSGKMMVQATGETPQEVILPDQSKVTLRKGSTLQYNKSFKEREVELTGEAYFEVTHDEAHPFSVIAEQGVVRVLGTKFNLKALNNGPVELVVTEGQVAFAPVSRKLDAKIFSAGQAGQLGVTWEAEVERVAPPGQNVTSWVNGKLIFDHATLDHVLADISRHFSVPFVADSTLYSCELKADFEQATIDNVIETLRFSLNLQIEKTGTQYVVSGLPCATVPKN